MRKFNFIRPIFLIVVALLVKSFITNLCKLFGMTPDAAENLGFIAMLVATIIIYSRIAKARRK
ncbi:hypothetical protein [Paenibacillus sinopodophylli]|uniref:hypothetical protein n=1 Tax=Paenibacillus sinopodophylli TaxID=1837342 RepID=UPI00110CECF3|nr:hypothetical protein [Paenibacillus sinopodophylli]